MTTTISGSLLGAIVRHLGVLTHGETRVLHYLPTNLSAPEIAGELYLSANTVRTPPAAPVPKGWRSQPYPGRRAGPHPRLARGVASQVLTAHGTRR
jgi:hypothetical protein